MESIPVLGGLNNDQFETLLSICSKKSLHRSQVLFEEGDRSRDMYILTEGALSVQLWGKEINRIFPIRPVGEMGLFTGEPRSATITAVTKSSLLHIEKDALFDLFENDKDLHVSFQLGLIIDLSEKMRLTNEVIAKIRSKMSNKI